MPKVRVSRVMGREPGQSEPEPAFYRRALGLLTEVDLRGGGSTFVSSLSGRGGVRNSIRPLERGPAEMALARGVMLGRWCSPIAHTGGPHAGPEGEA